MTTTSVDRGAPGTELALTVPATASALPGVRRALDAWLSSTGAPQDTRHDVVLVVDEALTNAIEHGYRCAPDHTIDLAAVHTPAGVHIRVRDSGTWKPPTDDGTRGRGLHMIHTIADVSSLTVTDENTTLSAHIPHRP